MPKQLRDSPKVLYFWLVTDSDLELANPDSISVVLKWPDRPAEWLGWLEHKL